LERDGELKVFRNQGRRGVNIYKSCLPLGNPGKGDVHATSDIIGARPVTSMSSTSDAAVIQSVNESSIGTTPIVPKRDYADFWIEISFRCFGQDEHPLQPYILRRLLATVSGLDRSHADSLLKFYRAKPLDSKEPPYTSRRHTPERLLLDLPRQLALAVKMRPPQRLPKEHNFTIHDVNDYLITTYPGSRLLSSLEELDKPRWGYMREEIYDAMSKRTKTIN
jgi:hypothetical protein